MRSLPLSESGSSRSRLLRAAKRLFALQGYEQTATSAIAREAGTSESQLMRYFGGKVGLLDALFDDAWAHINARVRRAVRSAHDGRSAVLAAFQTLTSALGRDPDLATLVLFEGRRLRGDEPRIRVSAGLVAFAEMTRGLVRQAQANHEIDARLDAAAVASALEGACEAMIRDRMLARVGRGRAFADREIKRTLEVIMSSFAPRAGRNVRAARTVRARAS